MDRVTFNEPGQWTGPDYAVGAVDEIVISDALVHLEMLSDCSAHLAVDGPDRVVVARVTARPTSRGERRQVLTCSRDRLRDLAVWLLPRCLQPRGRRCIWLVPWWQRPVSVWRAWQAARREACAVLEVRIDNEETK